MILYYIELANPGGGMPWKLLDKGERGWYNRGMDASCGRTTTYGRPGRPETCQKRPATYERRIAHSVFFGAFFELNASF